MHDRIACASDATLELDLDEADTLVFFTLDVEEPVSAEDATTEQHPAWEVTDEYVLDEELEALWRASRHVG